MRQWKRRISELLFEGDYVKFGEFILTSGLRSPYYVNLRDLPSRPQHFRAIVNAILYVLGEAEYDAICGIAVGGLPLATAVAYSAGRPLVYHRKPKEHGIPREIEGELEGGSRIVIVDDVLTTGGSILRAARALREVGLVPVGATVVVDREQGGAEALAEAGLWLRSVLKITELMENLKKLGLISRDRYLEVLEYVRKGPG